MNRLEITVELAEGLHTRPAGRLAELFMDIEGRMIAKGGEANLSSMLSLMTLGVQKGETVVIETQIEMTDELQTKISQILQG